jgi:hypothetical protein
MRVFDGSSFKMVVLGAKNGRDQAVERQGCRKLLYEEKGIQIGRQQIRRSHLVTTPGTDRNDQIIQKLMMNVSSGMMTSQEGIQIPRGTVDSFCPTAGEVVCVLLQRSRQNPIPIFHPSAMINHGTLGLLLAAVGLLLLPSSLLAFQFTAVVTLMAQQRTYYDTMTTTRLYDSETTFEVELDMPPSNSGNKARLKFGSVLSFQSEIVEVRYQLPFGLDVAPIKNLAVCTKDGAGGGMCRGMLD